MPRVLPIPLQLALVLALALPAAAQQTARPSGPLSDRAIYDVVTCNVAPGTPCREARPKWPAAKRRALTVAIVAVDDGYGEKKAGWVREGIANAVAEINAVGADLKLTWVAARRADIQIHLVASQSLGSSSGNWADQIRTLGAVASAQLSVTRGGAIRQANITVSAQPDRRGMRALMLSQLLKGVGLLHNLNDDYYDARSVFFDGGRPMRRLGKQDAAVIQMHYPPGG